MSSDNRQPGGGEIPTWPALRALMYQQRSMLTGESDADFLEHGFRDGFPNRAYAIEWYQSAVVRTLGYLTEDWEPQSLLQDRSLIAHLLKDRDARKLWVRDPPTDATAHEWRLRMESQVIMPACTKGYRNLRGGADEYLNTDETPSQHAADPENQRYVAMRPGYQHLDRMQHRALQQLWAGFANRNAVMEWAHGLVEPSNGELDEDFGTRLLSDRTAVKMLLKRPPDDRAAMEYREMVAIQKLLPAFAAGVQSTNPTELAKTTQTSGTFEFE